MPHHIEKRRLGWYAALRVPKDVQEEPGREWFRQSLRTRDEKLARRLAKPVVAQWQQQVAVARSKANEDDDPAARWAERLRDDLKMAARVELGRRLTERTFEVDADPAVWRQQMRDAKRHDAQASDPQDAQKLAGVHADLQCHIEDSAPAAKRFWCSAAGDPTEEHLEKFIASLDVRPKKASSLTVEATW